MIVRPGHGRKLLTLALALGLRRFTFASGLASIKDVLRSRSGLGLVQLMRRHARRIDWVYMCESVGVSVSLGANL